MNLSDYCREVAWRLELNGDTSFRVNAYRKAATALESAGNGDYSSVDGIGKSIAKDLEQVKMAGTSDRLEKLRAGGPPATLMPILGIRGVGTSRLMELYKAGVNSLDDLGALIKTHQLRDPKLSAGYYAYLSVSERFRADLAQAAFKPWLETLQAMPGVVYAGLVGSYRRSRPDLRDLDVLIAVRKPEVIVSVGRLAYSLGLQNMKRVDFRTAVFEIMVAGKLRPGKIHFCGPSEVGTAELWFTGSKQFGVNLERFVSSSGGELTPYSLTYRTRKHIVNTEDDVFRALGLAWIPPECRDNHVDPQAPIGHLLESVCGDFHCHTQASDGLDNIQTMAKAAQALGHCYLGVTDHTQSSGHGMHKPHALDHATKLKSFASGGIKVLAGVEMDVRMDGTTDHDVESFSAYDYVVLSCHQDPTRDNVGRLETAFKSIRAVHARLPLVLAHPTGRLIGVRPESDSESVKLFQLCAQYNCALEVNGQPARADLPDHLLVRAKRYRCKFIASSDAHSRDQLRYIENSVQVCRRALLSQSDVINADRDSVEAWLSGADLRTI